MNPRAFFFIVLAVIAILAALIGIGYLIVWKRAGVNVREFKRTRRDRDLAIEALWQIKSEVIMYSDIDSPLAAKLRPILEKHDRERIENYK